jgi:hypothetical protein
MASWTKTVGTLASSLSCAAGSTLSVPQAFGAGTNFSSTLSIPSGSSVGIAGSITNGTAGPGVAAVVGLMASNDTGSTWYLIDRAAGLTGASANAPFAFSLIPDGWELLALYVYNNTTNAVTLNAIYGYGASFS